jgi:hypothetical protein
MWNRTQEQAAFIIETATKSVWIDGYGEGRKDMLAKAIAAVEAIEFDAYSSTEWDRDYNLDPSGETRYPRIWIHEAITALRALQERP